MVVCTKADLIDDEEDTVVGGLGVVKGKGGEWEERTDGIMQVLRTISLKCQRLPAPSLTPFLLLKCYTTL